MVWGAFGVNDVLELKKIRTTINSIGYQEILKTSLIDKIYNIVENINEKIIFFGKIIVVFITQKVQFLS